MINAGRYILETSNGMTPALQEGHLKGRWRVSSESLSS